MMITPEPKLTASDVTDVAWEDTPASSGESPDAAGQGGDFTFCDTLDCTDSDSSCGGGS
jgi:hypothetical protein